MKKQLYRIVTGILAVAWMCLIFSFSNQPATESSKVSGGLCHRLVERANDTLHLDMTEKQQLAMAEKIEYPVRKAAHMTEYAILGLLSFAFYRGILKKEKRQFLAALLTAAAYAATRVCQIKNERGDTVVELDQFKVTLNSYRGPLQEVRDSL